MKHANQQTMPSPMTLRQAIEAGNLEQARAAIAAGADVNEVSANENFPTPLFLAVKKDQAEIVQLLMNTQADANHKRADVRGIGIGTPLSFAVKQKKLDLINIMIQSEHFRFELNTGIAVCVAIAFNQPELLSLLLEKHRDEALSVSLDFWESYGCTSLTLAVEKDDEVAVGLLIAHGADPHYITNHSSHTAFHKALYLHQPGSKILSLLMSRKKFNGDIAPFLHLLEKEEEYFALPLIEYDKDALLSAVIKRGYMTALRILLEQGLDPNTAIKDNPRWTPLMLAIYEHKIEAALMMVKSPQFVYTPHRGGTALMIASGRGYAEECKELMRLLEVKKSEYEDDLLWVSIEEDEDVIVVAPSAPVATTAPLTIIAPSVLKPVDKNVFDQEAQENKLYEKKGVFEL